MVRVCRVCGDALIIGKNVSQRGMDRSKYTCRKCNTEYHMKWIEAHPNYVTEYRHRTGRQQPMNKNRECSSFLGVHVAERVLSHLFKDVYRMPINNPGYDFICNKGYLVDAKSSCRYHHPHNADSWLFNIKKNQIAEYFLCLAFDNRVDLNPEHIWLIPAGEVNDHVSISIAESRLNKWSGYEHPVGKVCECCNILRCD